MRRKAIFLLIVITVFMPVSFTYGQYYTLASADFITAINRTGGDIPAGFLYGYGRSGWY